MLKNVYLSPKDERLPKLLTSFIASSLDILNRPENIMYPLINAFLLQRPLLDITVRAHEGNEIKN